MGEMTQKDRELARLRRENEELRNENERLEQLVCMDPLTGVSNRLVFERALSVALARAGRQDVPFGILMMDLDEFKQTNDEHGHPAGDAVLRAFSRCLLRSVRQTDDVCRLGGDEFGIILHGVSRDILEAVAARVDEHVRAEVVRHRGVRLSIRSSIGALLVPPGLYKTDDLYQRADDVLYRCKEARRSSDGEPIPYLAEDY